MSDSQSQLPATTEAPIACTVSEGFADWLKSLGGSILISTYQAGRVALVGWNGEQITMHLCHYPRPMGMAIQGSRLALAIRLQVVEFQHSPEIAGNFPSIGSNGAPDRATPGNYDVAFLPRRTHFSGPLDIHDLVYGRDGLWIVATQFSCLAQLSDEWSFVPRWTPPFITAQVPEDRCHLNGIAVVDGQPRYVTALGETDSAVGWRKNKAAGGILIDVPGQSILMRGLAMPHSPRWHDGRLWFLNSAAGELCTLEPGTSRYSVVALLPGFLRGLCFAGRYAIVGLCKLRASRTFGTLPLEFRFPELKCAVAAIDMQTGKLEAMLEFTGGCDELYDVQFLPGCTRPLLLNDQQMSQLYPVTTPNQAYLIEMTR